MKKLFSGKFLFILASSLVMLVLLTIGAFYLFNDEDAVFVKGGYVLNPLSSTMEKYFFDENVGYKENLSSMVEFVDVDENTVSVLKDSFLHYLDDSLSFLKKGAILDLDSVSGNKAVSFYNITANSIIEKKNNHYVIESVSGDIVLNNFIGRISDNKYIIVGDLSLKMAGNDTSIKGDYFEVVYVETGIVNIENKDIKYQVAAEDTIIYVGNDKLIDLGDKKIVVNGQDLMSMTAITIDGDENIEIIPKEVVEEEEEPDNNPVEQVPPVQETPGDQTTGDGTGDGTGTGEDDPNIEEEEKVIITLKDEQIGSTNVRVVFEVLNAKEEDNFKLQVVNLASGKTVDMVASVITDVPINVNLLTPSTKYLFTVVEEESNEKLFQKVIETSSFGITLEKKYATSNSIKYVVNVDDTADISSAKLTLYKFNEETGKNEVVTKDYIDSVTGEKMSQDMVVSLSSIGKALTGENEVLFDNLESDTIYTAVLDEFSVASSNFKDIYNITNTSMTLKRAPKFSDMTITKDVGAGSFDLSLGNITDLDNAIVGYTYVIYDKYDDSKPAIPEIYKNNASPITVKIGDGDDKLKNDTNYYYNVIIEYFDNEKYIEYVTTDSIIFMMGNEPYVTVVPNKELTTHEAIAASIYLTDNSCLLSMPGRDKCSGNSTVVVKVSEVNPLTSAKKVIYSANITFEVTEESIKYDLYLDNKTANILDKIMPGSTYNIELEASYNNSDVLEKKEIVHTEESVRIVTTKELSSFDLLWAYLQGTTEVPISASTRFTADEDSGTLTPEESLATINQVVISLYEGNNVANVSSMKPIASVHYNKSSTFNFKEKFYDQAFNINSKDTFIGLTVDELKKDGKFIENFIISVNAYTSTGYEIRLFNNLYVYKLSSLLLMEDVTEPTIVSENKYTNKDVDYYFENLKDTYFQGVTVGHSYLASFGREQLEANNIIPQKVHFYVYDVVTNERVKFYIKSEEGLTLVDEVVGNLEDKSYYETDIYFDYGTPYENVDDTMRRGNKYYVGFVVECKADGKQYFYPENKTKGMTAEYGVYKLVELSKIAANMKMYPASSTKDSITYKYVIKDPDNYLYKSPDSDSFSFNYQINDGTVKTIPLILAEGATYNHFDGTLTISGLSHEDRYNIYYMSNYIRSASPETDIKQSDEFGYRMFDGYYDAKSNINSYNFKYQVINNPLKDNKVVIKILATEEILDRIVSYELYFKDSKGNELPGKTKVLWQLMACPGDSENTMPRCLSVDYTELKNAGMKSEGNDINMISVKVTAYYDNGLTGFDYTVGNNADDDYKYSILQINSSELGLGNYISFTSSGSQVTVWTPELGVSKGFYQYAFGSETLIRYWGRHTNKTTPNNISVNLKFAGYDSTHGYLNPKMISVDEMECSNDNKFYFSSITPKVAVSQKSALINGTVLNLSLSGIDLNDLKKDEVDNEYYLYVETWDDNSKSTDRTKTIRPAVKVKINSSSPTTTINALIDGLKENTSHYFRIYTYMKNPKGGYDYTELFNAAVATDYVTSSYSYKTSKASDLFHNFSTSVLTSDEVYGNRILSTKMNLYAYANNIAFNFDLIYILCETNSEIPCGLGEGETYLFKQTVPQSKVSTSVTDTFDISKYDLEFGKSYYMYIYAHSDYYDNKVLTKRDVVLNRTSINVKFKTLSKPTFVVTRNAGIDAEGKYYIDFDVVVNDADRTLIDGNYFVKLTSNGSLVGNMQLKDENGVYYDVPNYGEYAFDAFVVSKHLRITGLESNMLYKFEVYGFAYLNNYSPDTLPGVEHRTQKIDRPYDVYSANDYGVAFGNDILFNATDKSIIVQFLGGSNFDNVVELDYTITMRNAQSSSGGTGGNQEEEEGTNSGLVAKGTYVIGENGKYFELFSGAEDWRFVINPPGLVIDKNRSYNVVISVKVRIPGTDNFKVLTSADIPGFEGITSYVTEK